MPSIHNEENYDDYIEDITEDDILSTEKSNRIDFSVYRNYLESWHDLYDYKLSYSENLLNLIKQSVYLSDADIQTKLFLIYVLIPSALSNVCPHLQIYGASGSGKSTLSFLASIIRGCEIYASASTFASIRNGLNMKKYDSHGLENNIIMIWDDIDPDIFLEQTDLYRIFKVSYARQTETMSTALPGGKISTYKTFCPKIFSSIHPFFSDTNFNELLRRLIVVKTDKINKTHTQELLDLTTIDWKTFSNLYHSFWDENKCEYFLLNKKILRKTKPSYIDIERYALFLDILATGMTFDLFDSASSAIKFYENYWELHDKRIKESKGALYELLEQLILEEVEISNKLNDMGIKSYLVINPTTIKKTIDKWIKQGKLETIVNPKLINKTMNNLGYRLSAKGWIRINDNNSS